MGTSFLSRLSNDSIPSGIICMWSGSIYSIPTGWALCDGTNNTPDLRDRFIVGAGKNYSVNTTGGSSTVVLQSTNLPAHTHTANLSLSGLSTNPSGNHTHNVGYVKSSGDIDDTYAGYSKESVVTRANNSSSSTFYFINQSRHTSIAIESGSHTHTISGNGSITINSAGGNAAHENMPPYYSLAYIMKL